MRRAKKTVLFGNKKNNLPVVLITALVTIAITAAAFFVWTKLSHRDAAAKQDEPVEAAPVNLGEQPELYTFGPIATGTVTTGEQVKAQLIESCAKKPEVLAAIVSAFPTLIEEAGVSLDTDFTIRDLDDLLGTDNQTRAKLFGTLEEALGRADTQYDFVEASDGWVNLLYLAKYDHDAEMSPETMSLVLAPAYIGSCEFVKVTIVTNDTAETAILFIQGGLQRAFLEPNPDYQIFTSA